VTLIPPTQANLNSLATCSPVLFNAVVALLVGFPFLVVVEMVLAPKKALKFGRALKTAARLPARVSTGKGSGRNSFSPLPGESPVTLLRVQVVSGKGLLSKDRNGASDP
jgi:hypothetical protein